VISAHPLLVRSPAFRSPRRGLLLCVSMLAAGVGCSDAVDELTGGGGDFDSIYNSATFQQCSECHAPDAPGRVAGTEATQDWSSSANARRTLRGSASGLIGNSSGCNGVPLLGSSAEQSLLVASLDSGVRMNFELADHPDCTPEAIADQTLHLSADPPASVLQDLKDWIDAGAP